MHHLTRRARYRLRRLLCALAALLVLAGCQVDVTVGLTVEEHGGGEVGVEAIFDADAVASVDQFEERLRLRDLADAGWEVADPVARADGSLRVVATRSVAGPDDWQGVLDQIAGPGVFNEVTVTPADAFARQATELAFDVDLRRGFDLLTDDEATELLDGQPFGAPLLQWTGGATVDEVVDVVIQTSVTADDDGTPVTSTFDVPFDEVLPVRIESVNESNAAVLLRWIGWALGALFVLSVLLAATGFVLERRAQRLHTDLGQPASLRDRVPGRPAETTRERRPGPEPVEPPATGPVRLVVIDPVRVLFGQHEAPENYLLPFVRHNGGTARADVVMDGFDRLIRGEIESDEFWQLCALENSPDASSVDATFLRMRKMRSGASDFLAEMERRRIPVAAISNDGAVWSADMRARDRLTGVWPWLVSAEVGATKPNLGMFERLRRETGVAYEHCLYIDTDVESLDTAKTLGMKTTFFDADPDDISTAIGHARVEGFGDFFKRRL